MNNQQTILDHIDNIIVPGLVFKNPSNEYWALICLWDGMTFLYRQAKHCDDTLRSLVNKNDDINYMGMGNLPELQYIPKSLLTCSFHWYAISVCNYVRTIGTIAYQQDNNRHKPLDYVKKVIPEILAFRDKVAAHFAWSTKNKKDNDAERFLSIIPQLVYINKSFHVGSISVTLRKAGEISKSKAIKAWSICKIHEELQNRYWPNKEKEDKL